MPVYGMNAASNLVMLDKATGLPALYIDYANATTAEFSSDSVYATAQGANAISWNNPRNGTLTLDTELFDLPLLAMTMGSKIKEGSANILQRKQAVLDNSKAVDIGAVDILPDSLSVVRLNNLDDTEHAGEPLFNAEKAKANLPRQVINVTVSHNDDSAIINFSRVNNANGYAILLDGETVSDSQQTNYTHTGLSPENPYEITVYAYNDFGKGPNSAVVEFTTSALGSKERVAKTATPEAINSSAGNEGTPEAPDANVPSFSFANGIIEFQNVAVGDAYAIYYIEKTVGARTVTITSDEFAGAYEIFADARIRPRGGGADELIYIHYFNARPQSNFTLTQSAGEPTSLNIVFDLFPEKIIDAEGKTTNALAEIHFID